MVKSLIIGGTRGIGLVVRDHLLNRGDLVYTVSRSKTDEKYHINCDISKDCSVISDKVDSIDNVIFMHRYRGNDWNDEFDITVKGVDNVVKSISNVGILILYCYFAICNLTFF